MSKKRDVTFSDLRVEDIRGGVFLDAITEYSDKWKDIYRALRELGSKLRVDFGFRGSFKTDLENPLSPSNLTELAGRGAEGAKLAEALLASRSASKSQPQRILMICDDPAFSLQVDSGDIRFEFDAVQAPVQSLEMLKRCLDVVLDKLAPVDLRKLGIRFRHIFYLKPGTKNFEVLGKTLLAGQTPPTGFYSAFGNDVDWGRTDLSWVYHHRGSDLVTQLKLEAPGNDNNTQIWLTADTQTRGEVLERQELTRLPEYLEHYKCIVEAFLSDVLGKDLLDTHRREMMIDEWLEIERRS